MNYEQLLENTIKSQEVYHGSFLHVYHDEVQLPSGKIGNREYIRHVGAVAVIPVDEELNVYIERQYRHPLRKVILEIPAGKLNDKFEDRLEAAKRELKEETGLTAKEWTCLGDYIPAAAYSDERITLYLTQGLQMESQNLDEDEFLLVEKVPLIKLVNECMNGSITDGKTLTGILKVARYLNI